MTHSTLTEHVADWHTGLRIDRTNRTVHNVALTGVTSKNGYRYTEGALRTATALYQDKPVFLDHALDKSRPHERSTRDLVGTIVNPRFESGRIRGDIRVLDTDSGRTFLALSESDAPGVGMSHVVLAQRASTDGAVDRIHDVVSVDAVVFPATTKTFRESVNEPSEDQEAEASDSLDLAAQQVTNASATDCPTCPASDGESSADPAPQQESTELHEQLQQLLYERDELLRQLHEIRHREEIAAREDQLKQQLRDADLPDYALTAEFRRQLLKADETTRTMLLTERRQLIESVRRQSPQSIERSFPQQMADVNHAFIAAIKHSAF